VSKKKVEQYKDYKSNRKVILEKQKKKAKRDNFLYATVAVVIIGIAIGGVVLTGYNAVKAEQALQPNYDMEELIIGDLSSIRTPAFMAEEIDNILSTDEDVSTNENEDTSEESSEETTGEIVSEENSTEETVPEETSIEENLTEEAIPEVNSTEENSAEETVSEETSTDEVVTE